MTLLSFVTPLFIYHGCSTRKMFWEENSTFGEFTPVKMKCFGRRNVRKHVDIKDSDKYITLDISLKFGSQENMVIISSEPKMYLGRLGKGLITSLGLNTNISSNNNKKSRCAITNSSMKGV